MNIELSGLSPAKCVKLFMIINGDKEKDLQNALGCGRTMISQKLNEKAEFTKRDIDIIKERYSLSPDMTYNIFFGS